MLAAIAVLAAGTAAPVQHKDVPLAGGGRQTYDLVLRKGDALRGAVEQRGIDVLVKLHAPDGRVTLEIDSPNGTDGPEPVAVIAQAAGTYVLEVSALEPTAAPGRYDVMLAAPGPATPADRQAAEALDLHTRSMAARNEALDLMGQAQFRRSRARYDEAERWARRALDLRERTFGADHYDVASTHLVLGLVYDEIGEYAAGERHFAQALRIQERLLGAGHPGLLTTQSDLGYLRLATGDYAGAEALFTDALARREKTYGPQSERMLAGLGGLAEALLKQGQLPRAEEVARRTLALREAVKQPSASTHADLGRILLAQGRTAEAEAACTHSRTLAEARSPAGRTQVASALLCLGRAAGDPKVASSLLGEGVRIREAAYGPEHPSVAEALAWEGEVLLRQGDKVRARKDFTRALEIRERRLGPRHPASVETRALLGGLDK